MVAIIFSIATFFSTFLGGLLAIRFKEKIHLVMGFTAGVILGVVAFDIFPEIISQVNENSFSAMEPMLALVLGFLIFHVLEKTILIHHAHEEDYAEHRHPHVGILSALALIGHSFMDGLGIGLGFKIGNVVGALIATAVIFHAFTDGMNTVALMLHHKNSAKKAKIFLLLVAVAPLLGVLLAFYIAVSPRFLLWYLGFFAGSLLYIGVSDILPEAHSKHSSLKLVGLTVSGAAFVFFASFFF